MYLAIVNDKSTEATEYLVVKIMASKVGLGSIFDDESLLKRFEKNIEIR